jgi:hypothetical protein
LVLAIAVVVLVLIVVIIVVIANPPHDTIAIADAIAIAAPHQLIVRRAMATALLFHGGGRWPWLSSSANFMAVARVLSTPAIVTYNPPYYQQGISIAYPRALRLER